MKRAQSRLVFAIFVLSLGASAFAFNADAQNTSSVSSPGVKSGEREIEYRFGWAPDDDGGDSYAHRFDYGFAINERTSLKVFATLEDRPGQDLRFDNINTEYLIELSPEGARLWQTGIRFDTRISNGPDAERLGLNWLNRWTLNDRISARAMLIATREFGDRAEENVAFELRSSVTYKLDGDYEAALLAFNELGTTDAIGTGGLPQQVGPTLSGPLGQGWRWTAGNLFGVSDSAPDNDIRLWVSRDL
ncbi:hypothetical protein [Henriciella aquimarina]|uniref:hypothetical protein n=1 Tax=Henriciella aquimarina TaxID=545261 RepID=UPI0009FEC4AC|nr:hypothetical protein [Henriciella aquimarina]